MRTSVSYLPGESKTLPPRDEPDLPRARISWGLMPEIFRSKRSCLAL